VILSGAFPVLPSISISIVGLAKGACQTLSNNAP